MNPHEKSTILEAIRPYQPKTGQKCTCKRGQQRDNCPNCEGTGWVIDFRAIREGNRPQQDGIQEAHNLYIYE